MNELLKRKVKISAKSTTRDGEIGTFLFEREIFLRKSWRERIEYDLIGLEFNGQRNSGAIERYKVISVENIEIENRAFYLHPSDETASGNLIELIFGGEEEGEWYRFVHSNKIYSWTCGSGQAIACMGKYKDDWPEIRQIGPFWVIENTLPIILAHKSHWRLSYTPGPFDYIRSYQFWNLLALNASYFRR